jgi:hypothetical protein
MEVPAAVSKAPSTPPLPPPTTTHAPVPPSAHTRPPVVVPWLGGFAQGAREVLPETEHSATTAQAQNAVVEAFVSGVELLSAEVVLPHLVFLLLDEAGMLLRVSCSVIVQCVMRHGRRTVRMR